MQRACDMCGVSYEAKRRTSKFCSSNCRVRASRGQVVISMPVKAGMDAPTEAAASPLVESYRRRLREAERLDTPAGVHVLMLADLLTSAAHTASGAAALSRELRSAMDDALKGALRAADPLDEISARRAQKMAGA